MVKSASASTRELVLLAVALARVVVVVVQVLGPGGSSMPGYLRGEGRMRNGGGPPRSRGRTAGGGAGAKGGAGKPVNSCTMARKLEVSVVSTVVGGRRDALGRFLAGFVVVAGAAGAGGSGGGTGGGGEAGEDMDMAAVEEEVVGRRPWKEESRYRLAGEEEVEDGKKKLWCRWWWWWWEEVNSWSAAPSSEAVVGMEGDEGRLSLVVDAMDDTDGVGSGEGKKKKVWNSGRLLMRKRGTHRHSR